VKAAGSSADMDSLVSLSRAPDASCSDSTESPSPTVPRRSHPVLVTSRRSRPHRSAVQDRPTVRNARAGTVRCRGRDLSDLRDIDVT
jgi:hypothetical protein